MQPLPAIVIGGPPHSGKSVFTYVLTQALRAAKVEHYVLRACPDGEGDWSNETPPETVRLLRNKGQFTDSFVTQVCRALDRRHLPLLVDVGGRPTQEQEQIFDCCTHAIILSHSETALVSWRDLMTRHHLTIIAELQSTLTEAEAVFAEYPILSGRIRGLERHQPIQSPLLDRLAWNVKTLFGLSTVDLPTFHMATVPVELGVDLERMRRAVQATPSARWYPADLPAALDYLPPATPIALYGRGPNWLYAALAAHAMPAAFYQFDPRLGWVEPPHLTPVPNPPAAPLHFRQYQQPGYDWLEVQVADTYLDYSEAQGLAIPVVAADRGLVLSGKMPHWLLTALARAYQQRPWLAVYQPQQTTTGPAILVATQDSSYGIGQQLDGLPNA